MRGMRSHVPPRWAEALVRLALRLIVIGVLAAWWPHRAFGSAVALASLLMALSCALAAVIRHEPWRTSELTRWDEAVALLGVSLLAHLFAQ
jgi:hypothetical protein